MCHRFRDRSGICRHWCAIVLVVQLSPGRFSGEMEPVAMSEMLRVGWQ